MTSASPADDSVTAPNRPVTLSDVARHAGVSVPTASRILNGGVRGATSGTPELRERVRMAADALGYAASTAAQTIKDGRSRSIAVLVGSIDDVGASAILSGVMHAAEERGLSVAVRETHDEAAHEIEQLRRLRGDRPRGVVVATTRSTDSERETAVAGELAILRRQGTAIAVIGDSTLPYPKVVIDTHEAAAALARALVGAGARSFALVSGPADEVTASSRAAGFLDGLRASGVAPASVPIIHAEFSREGGRTAAMQLCGRASGLDVIAAMSDALAVGLVVGLREGGVRVPDDVAVSGFDGVQVVRDLLPALSTVEVPLEDLGRAAVHVVLGPDVEEHSTVLLTHRIVAHDVR